MFQIVFEGKRGGTFAGDIALDNIRYIPGRCGIVIKNDKLVVQIY
jgi:hypothetical protein